MTERELADAVRRLYVNDDFQAIIVKEFIDNGVHKYCLNDNVDSEGVRDELKARKILNDFLFNIIETDEILKSEKEN